MKRSVLPIASVLFVGGLLASWATHGTGIVQDDPARNIAIPDTLTVPLQVQAAYNDTTMFVRYRWPAEKPGIFHDVLVYEDGEWVRHGRGMPGSNPEGFHEDRVAMMLDDGSVPMFSRYGGYIAIGAGLAGLTDEAPEEVTKYLPATRNRLGAWDDMAPEDVQAKLRQAGYFLDLWHWRGARSNALGYSDDQYVGAKRGGDGGASTYGTNWDKEASQPKVMFNPETAGFRALKWDDIMAGRVTQDQTYALTPEVTVAFDPEASWQNGDVIPRRILTPPEGSRGDITTAQGVGTWANGYWDVTLSRALDTGHPQDDKILGDLGMYDVAIAIHRNATGGRWHYVSLPQSLGLGRDADIKAVSFKGNTPQWGDGWTDVTLFYPGQVTWPFLNSRAHAGAEYIAEGVPVAFRHTPEQLANYGVEVEFMPQIKLQWILTMLGGIVLIAGFGIALNRSISATKGA